MDCKLYIRVQYFIFPFIIVKFSVLFCPFIVTQEKEEFLEDFFFFESYGDSRENKDYWKCFILF